MRKRVRGRGPAHGRYQLGGHAVNLAVCGTGQEELPAGIFGAAQQIFQALIEFRPAPHFS